MKSISKLLCAMTALSFVSVAFGDDKEVIMLKRKTNGELVVANDPKSNDKATEEKKEEVQTPRDEKFSWFAPRRSTLEGGVTFQHGDKLSSFSGTNGFYLESMTEFGNSTFFSLVGKVAIAFNSGSVTFTDAGVQTYSYMYFGGYAGIGARFYGVTNEQANVRPFIEGYGLGAVGGLKFSSTVNTLQPTGMSLGFGYELGAGMDFALHSKKGKYSDSISVSLNYRSITMNLAGKTTFMVGGFGIGAGYSW
jgi:hypothetical protein